MEWDKETLNKFLKVFNVSKKEIIALGIPRTALDSMLYRGFAFTRYNEELLSAFLKSRQDAKKAEYEAMIMYYQNFK